MRKYLVACLALLAFTGLAFVASCEKDDICVEGDTPLLVLEFVNAEDTTALKNVPSLRVIGLGNTAVANGETDRTNVSTVKLPLKTNENSTSFLLIQNSASNDDGLETGDIDTLELNFTRIEDFASRACGFVVSYEELSATVTDSGDRWIQGINIIRSQVINSDSTHVQILH